MIWLLLIQSFKHWVCLYIIKWWKIWFLNLIIGLHDIATLKREGWILEKSPNGSFLLMISGTFLMNEIRHLDAFFGFSNWALACIILPLDIVLPFIPTLLTLDNYLVLIEKLRQITSTTKGSGTILKSLGYCGDKIN